MYKAQTEVTYAQEGVDGCAEVGEVKATAINRESRLELRNTELHDSSDLDHDRGDIVRVARVAALHAGYKFD